MICPNCGAQLPDTARMCFSCKIVFQQSPVGYQQRTPSMQYNNTSNLRQSNVPYHQQVNGPSKGSGGATKSIIIAISIIALVLIIGAVVIVVLGRKGDEGNTKASNTKNKTTQTASKESDTSKKTEEITTEFEYHEDITYDNLARTPDNYEGMGVIFSGEVVQTIDGKNSVDVRVAIDGDYDDMAYIVYDTSITDQRILENDYVTFKGVSQGLYTYESTLGAQITIPLIYVDEIDIEDKYSGSISGSSTGNTTTTPISDTDFEIKSYEYTSYGYVHYYLIITNNSLATVEINGTGVAYDSDGNKKGAANGDIDVLAPGETSIMLLWFDDLETYDHIEYQLSYDEDIYYLPVIGNLSYTESNNGTNVVLDVTNNGDYSAEFVEAYAVLFDANGNVIDVQSSYFVDDDSEIKPGATITDQISFYKSCDHYEIYFTGRHSKW